MSSELRRKVLYQYKELIYMGKDYPAGYDFFIKKLRGAFKGKSTLSDPQDIEKALALGEYVKKGIYILTYEVKKKNLRRIDILIFF